MGQEDAAPGQIWVYEGRKTSTGDAFEKAGLTNGENHVLDVAGDTAVDTDAEFRAAYGKGTPVKMRANVVDWDSSGARQNADAANVGLTLNRIEDGAFDPKRPNDFYFLTTEGGAPDSGAPVEQPRDGGGLWRLRFADVRDPTAGAKLTLLLDGTEAPFLSKPDNMDLDQRGNILIQEDPGGNAALARIVAYRIKTGELKTIAQFDPALFEAAPWNGVTPIVRTPANTTAAEATIDEESSGIIDVRRHHGRGRATCSTRRSIARTRQRALPGFAADSAGRARRVRPAVGDEGRLGRGLGRLAIDSVHRQFSGPRSGGAHCRSWHRPPQPNTETQGDGMGVLDDKVAIVTGSARGIGRATAEILSEHGAQGRHQRPRRRRRAADRRRDRGRDRRLRRRPDAGDAPDKLVQTAIDSFGRLDIIVNNAGYTLDAPIHKMSDDWWQRMLDIHVTVPFKVIRAAAPHLREPAKAEKATRASRCSARSSTSRRSPARWATPARPTTRPARRQSSGLTKTLAKEWGQFKVNCNAIAFGYIETRLTASKDESNVMEVGGEKVQLGIPDQLRGMASMLIPLGRPGTPEEAAGGVFFLCSPWSNYVHGQVLNVTGGQFTGMTT